MKAIVVGAGVLGASVAYQLVKRGTEVTIIDKGVPGDAASSASFAWLNSNNKKLRPYHDLNVMSIGEWSALARELGNPSWLRPVGNIHIADNAVDAVTLQDRVERLQSYGYAAIPLSPKELPRLDSVIRLRDEYEYAVYFPSEGFITIPELIHDLLGAATEMGAIVRHTTNVTDLIHDGDRITGVVLDGQESIKADVVVLAAGSGIGQLLGTQGIDMNTEGTPGVSVITSPGASELSTVAHFPGLSVRPDSGGRLLVRSKSADNQIDLPSWSLPEHAIRELFEQAAERISDFDAARVRGERVQIASRPYPFDGLPVVGFWDGLSGVYVMTMHSGVTMGAIMGRLAAEEITSGEQTTLLEGFRPARAIQAAASGVGHVDPYAIEGEQFQQASK